MELNLRDKGSIVEALWHSVDDATGNLANVPGLVRRVIETEAWREREHRGKRYAHASFRSFIATKPPAGCGWPPDKVEALIRSEPEVLAMWREATTAAPHRPTKESRDNVTTKREGGNSRAYTLARLKRERSDLFKRVVAGKLSANAAAIEAGWRKKPSALDQISKLLSKLTEDELRDLTRHIEEMLQKDAA